MCRPRKIRAAAGEEQRYCGKEQSRRKSEDKKWRTAGESIEALPEKQKNY
jgi:hypothetical protein